MIELKDALAAYAAAWGEPDAAKRAAMLEICWSDTAVYQDPKAHVEGRAALCDYIGDVQEQFPGLRIEVTSGVDMHHDSLRFGWCLRLANGATAIEGIDFATVASDGRLAGITGFFGPKAVRVLRRRKLVFVLLCAGTSSVSAVRIMSPPCGVKAPWPIWPVHFAELFPSAS